MILFAPHEQYEQTIATNIITNRKLRETLRNAGQREMTGRQLFEIYICERARELVIRRRKNYNGPLVKTT